MQSQYPCATTYIATECLTTQLPGKRRAELEQKQQEENGTCGSLLVPSDFLHATQLGTPGHLNMEETRPALRTPKTTPSVLESIQVQNDTVTMTAPEHDYESELMLPLNLDPRHWDTMPRIMPDSELQSLCRHGSRTADLNLQSLKRNPVLASPKSRTNFDKDSTPGPVATSHEEQQHCASQQQLAMPLSHPTWTTSSSGAHRGRTALHIAAERGNLQIVRLLIEHEVDVDLADALGCTALHHAARGAHVEVVALLLAGGADSEARDGEGRSPLHVAADAECESVIKLLARDGADLNAVIGCVTAGRAATSLGVLSGRGEGGEVADGL